MAGKDAEKPQRVKRLKTGAGIAKVGEPLPLRKNPAPIPRKGFSPTERSRLVVSDMVYHQPPGAQPTLTQTKFTRWLDSDEQVYTRLLDVNGHWKKLDIGWLSDSGMLVIRNNEERPLMNPTPEQVEEMKSRVIEVAISSQAEQSPKPSLIIRPGESGRFEPAQGSHLYIRVRSGEIKATITAIPL